jgi:hypothetical protein
MNVWQEIEKFPIPSKLKGDTDKAKKLGIQRQLLLYYKRENALNIPMLLLAGSKYEIPDRDLLQIARRWERFKTLAERRPVKARPKARKPLATHKAA